MLWLTIEVFIVLLSFCGSLAAKCDSLSDEPYMAESTFIDLNPIELNYYPFMISLDKCNGSCNVVVYLIVNANSIVQLAIQIKNGIMIHVNESVKKRL